MRGGWAGRAVRCVPSREDSVGKEKEMSDDKVRDLAESIVRLAWTFTYESSEFDEKIQMVADEIRRHMVV